MGNGQVEGRRQGSKRRLFLDAESVDQVFSPQRLFRAYKGNWLVFHSLGVLISFKLKAASI